MLHKLTRNSCMYCSNMTEKGCRCLFVLWLLYCLNKVRSPAIYLMVASKRHFCIRYAIVVTGQICVVLKPKIFLRTFPPVCAKFMFLSLHQLNAISIVDVNADNGRRNIYVK